MGEFKADQNNHLDINSSAMPSVCNIRKLIQSKRHTKEQFGIPCSPNNTLQGRHRP